MSSSDMARSLELQSLGLLSFRTKSPPWLPPNAPGVFGGTLIAHCLVAALKTVPCEHFVDSMHCNFLVGVNPNEAIHYQVENLSDVTDNVLRTVRAQQEEKLVFLASLSFRKERQKGDTLATRRQSMPNGSGNNNNSNITDGGLSSECPFVCSKVEVLRSIDRRPEKARTLQWIKTRDTLDDCPGGILHVAALAYMSDNYLLATASRIHNLLWERDPEYQKGGSIAEDSYIANGHVEFMVTLDHSIYFHYPTSFRADEWMMSEMETPWTGCGRALVMQKIFQQDGTLIATAVQEGVLRLQQDTSRL